MPIAIVTTIAHCYNAENESICNSGPAPLHKRFLSTLAYFPPPDEASKHSTTGTCSKAPWKIIPKKLTCSILNTRIGSNRGNPQSTFSIYAAYTTLVLLQTVSSQHALHTQTKAQCQEAMRSTQFTLLRNTIQSNSPLQSSCTHNGVCIHPRP